MEESKVNVTLRSINDQFVALDVKGEVTAFAEEEMMSGLTSAMQSGAQGIILNFAGLDYMTSSGIGLLVTLFIRANRENRRLYAVGLDSHYKRIFELTRLNENIMVFPTEQDVLAKA